MSKKDNIIMPSDEEDKAINAGIAADPEAFEWTDEMFATAQQGIPQEVEGVLKRTRGKQKAPKKVPVSLRLDEDVLQAFKNTGKGWQTRINEVLASHLPH